MTDALQYFLFDPSLCEDVDYPDPAFHFAALMSFEDWQAIVDKWDDYGDSWHKAMVYFAGFSPISNSKDILIKGLYDFDDSVILSSLLSIYRSLMDELDDAKLKKRKSFEFSPDEKSKITSSCVKFYSFSIYYPEFDALVQILEC